MKQQWDWWGAALLIAGLFIGLVAGYAWHLYGSPCPSKPPCENSNVFCVQIDNQQRQVPTDDMILRIVEDVKVCVEIEPASRWYSSYKGYIASLEITSRDVIRADTVCFKTTDCTEDKP